MLNKLLLKQINKKVGGLNNIPKDLLPLLEAVSQSYDHYERERLLTERSMDISSRELMEANEKLLVQTKLLQKSNEELKQFGYAVSHDLKEPLRTIASYIQLVELRTKDNLTDETREFMNFAVAGVRRMQQMLEAMLQYAQVDGVLSPPAPVNLQLAIEAALFNLSQSFKQANATWQCADNLPTVYGHHIQLVMLFQNLISNSIKFKSNQPLVIEFTFKALHKNYLFSFRDNGIGIPIQERDRVFNLFRRGHTNQNYEGVGMGLSICKKIVENHGGEIWIEDTFSASGCQIHFTLPLMG